MNFIATRLTEAELANAADLIAYGIDGCDLGKVLVARSKIGVCAILLGANRDEMERSLAAIFPTSLLVPNRPRVRDELAKAVQFIASPKDDLDLELDVRGTPFQHRVWDALRTVKSGRPVTYAQLACRVHGPKSLRAIAQACSENPIALAIPCHRVMGNSGSTSGYRWGVERKRALVNRELAAA
jgi:methylated-DNA-[protein]-cysteine S-methyltransferase/AraC family transcriptional regulator of adaptative response/methylated-DNA-[protein]-cysteine methyltransferase